MKNTIELRGRGELTNVILSIRPKYINAIKQGQKKYEFRKIIFRQPDIDNIYVYSTFPVKKIVGTLQIGDIIEDTPEMLWQRFQKKAGVGENEFFTYFNGNRKGFALKINDFQEFHKPIDPWFHNPDFIAPQSFCYISNPITI